MNGIFRNFRKGTRKATSQARDLFSQLSVPIVLGCLSSTLGGSAGHQAVKRDYLFFTIQASCLTLSICSVILT